MRLLPKKIKPSNWDCYLSVMHSKSWCKTFMIIQLSLPITVTCLNKDWCLNAKATWGFNGLMARDHSSPRNAEFWAEPRNFPVSAEFLFFFMEMRNLVLAGDVGDRYSIFWSILMAACIHDFTTKYTTATRALMGGILKIYSWAYLKYCRLIW